MIVNREALLYDRPPIKDMRATKSVAHGTSYGLTEAGYDLRIQQDVLFTKNGFRERIVYVAEPGTATLDRIGKLGRFALASAMEEFDMPSHLVGVVHDKSTWARRGLSVFNTVIEPGWKGFLTLELVYHGEEDLIIPAGSGIAQVLFHQLKQEASYNGKYQNQEAAPVPSKES
ncbi:dCTP deaminase [Achromobacter phage vB_AxyP_19-32_Axy11]|uniref:Putative deoxycytidine triphosphate deaminase n=1 Tax=Achromobacter phage vB_AxyP_19-32_Axy11 TaxID=2591042 RepID=A0A514CU78_9CAUD|nr:dCTP deaminase [Achromobacter phage vB_AxyP_19-32_Axy11]QDH84029.1 putative deoxycytidine triphosphate deaminase [Achromobacter phage vB_AxyP_19-32_Axy11]